MSSALQEADEFEVSKWVAPDVGDDSVANSLRSENTLAELKDRARRTGYAEGLQAGQVEGRAQIEERVKILDQLLAQLTEPLARLEPEMLQAMLELSVQVSEALIKRELSIDSSLVLSAVADALKAVPDSAQRARIYVNPEDLELVRETYATAALATDPIVEADSSVARGEARVESGSTVIDAQLRSRLDSLLSALLNPAESDD